MTRAHKATSEDIEYAWDFLKTLKIRSGETIYTETEYGKGMTDYVRVFIRRNGEFVNITHPVDIVTFREVPADNSGKWRIPVGGCGYSKSFHVVHGFGRTIRPDYRCTGTRNCMSNDHVNGDREYRKGKKHSDGGYAFKHRQL